MSGKTIYLDESGDLGFNFENSYTRQYFIISLLVCSNKATIQQIDKAVKRTLKNKLHAKKSRPSELKGTETTLAIKKYFYRHIEYIGNWRLYSIVLDKKKLKKYTSLLPTEHRIYNHLSKEILKAVNLTDIKSQLLLVVDKRKGKEGINEFDKYLSNHLTFKCSLRYFP